MAIPYGILAESGVEDPSMLSQRDVARQHKWIVDQEFTPVEGKSYELAFGKILFDGEVKHLVRRVRITGPARDGWIDLDAAKPLDQALQACQVKAFRPL